MLQRKITTCLISGVTFLYLLSSFEIQMSDMSGRAFYPLISRINHSCMPNLAHANIYHIDNNNSKQIQNGINGIYNFCFILS